MVMYYTNEFIFELPEILKDKTNHIFSITDDGPSPFNLVISRNPIDKEQTLQTYGLRLRSELEKALPNFQLSKEGVMIIAGNQTWGLDYRWLNQGQWLHQRQISFFHEANPNQRQIIQITGTAVGQFTEQWVEVFSGILGSIRLRQYDNRTG